MWAPVDIPAILTAKELTDAKCAIEQMEIELKDALLLLEQAQLRVTNIEKDLQERRAWITPIRRLPFDVLSPIFEFCGEDDWRTPLRIAGVSRQWRGLVLSVPRAWAFPEAHKLAKNTEALEHFFRYSGQQPLHVLLGPSQRISTLHEVAKQMKCLSVYKFSQIEEILVFPKLERLSLRHINGDIELSDLQIARFPALLELICEPRFTGGIIALSSSIIVTFPPLQVLSIVIDEDTAWLDLLMGCRSSLVSLRLHIADKYPDSTPQVLLPMLRCLEIHLWSYFRIIWPMDLRTPVLETYVERREYPAPPFHGSPVHHDVGTVTQIRITRDSNLSSMTLLRIIQLGMEVEVADVLSQFQANQSLCPRLELIELMRAGDLASYKTSLVEVNRERSSPISIRNVKTWATGLPYEILRSPVSN